MTNTAVAPVQPVQAAHATSAAKGRHTASKQEPGQTADAFAALMEALAGDAEPAADAPLQAAPGKGEVEAGAAAEEPKTAAPAESRTDTPTALQWLAQASPSPAAAPVSLSLGLPVPGGNAPEPQASTPTAAAGSTISTQKTQAADRDPLPAVPVSPRDASPTFAPTIHKTLSSAAEPAASARATAPAAISESLPTAPATVNLPTISTAAPATVLEATLQSRPGEPTFANELAAQVSVMVEGELQSARLELNPPELGPIRIELNLDGANAEMSFSAAHAATREGIEKALPELRELLAQQGLHLGETGVSTGGGQGGAHEQAQARRDESVQQRFALQRPTVSSSPAPIRIATPRGALDLYA